jgi:exosortase E/protease (VPEID-CTERM system)
LQITFPRAYRRITLLGLLFVPELLILSLWLDGASLSAGNAVTLWMQRWGSSALRSVVAFSGLFLILGYLRAKPELLRIGEASLRTSIVWRFLAGHVCALALCGALAPLLYGGSARGFEAGALAVVWIAAGLLAILLAAIALIPMALWLQLFRATGNIWIYASLAGLLAGCFGSVVRLLWAPAARVTFVIVKVMLSPLVPHIVSDPATMDLGTPAFNVIIDPACSGLEGMGLVLVFGVVWLWLFRRDLRFPQALFLVPVGLVAVFLLNSVRIAALILIGNAGAPGIALGGFHSQAGWIAFNVVALCLTLGAQRIPGISARPTVEPAPAAPAENTTVAYLLPFLAILAAAMISRAFSARFEWLYPLRFFAAAAVLWWNRQRYRNLNWHFGWLGLSAGTLVFAMWIALDRLATSQAAGGAVAGLTAGHGAAWTVWLVLRTLGAVVSVPLAEELAFRGYLLRRLVSADFERVDFRGVSLVALLVSSLAFGMMHGARWLAGALAGLAYALVVRRQARIGESVAAHACTNALLAAWVISRGEWRLW